MTIDWVEIEAAIGNGIAAQRTTTIDAAVAALKAALDTFLATFTRTPDADYAKVAEFLTALGTATTTAEAWLTAAQIKAAIPSDMTGWVTDALEAMVEASLAEEAQGVVGGGGGHGRYLPHQPA